MSPYKITLTAARIDTDTPGLSQIMPELVNQALGRGAVENLFLYALQRLGTPACEVAESITDEQFGGEHPQAERLLSRLGSQRYFDNYLTRLSDPDPQRVRWAIARLIEIGNPDAVDAIGVLLEHPQLNVQFDARNAIATLGKDS